MEKRNKDIRAAAKEAGVFHYEIAEKLGVSENTFLRMLRKEQPDMWKVKVHKAIQCISYAHERERKRAEKAEIRAFQEELTRLRKSEKSDRASTPREKE